MCILKQNKHTTNDDAYYFIIIYNFQIWKDLDTNENKSKCILM